MVMNTISLIASPCRNISPIHHLSTLFRALEILAARHEIVKYYLELNDLCIEITQNMVRRDVNDAMLASPTTMRGEGLLASSSSANVLSVPPTRIYSFVLRTLDTCFKNGNVDKTAIQCY